MASPSGDPIAEWTRAPYDRKVPPRLEERPVEDFQEQEYEFLRRLDEERLDRRTLLRRGVAAGAGLTILSLSPSALAARQQALATAPTLGRAMKLTELVKEAKKEGRLNTIALPPNWANYGEIIRTFTRKYGIPITSADPDASSAAENQAVRSLKGDPRAPDVARRQPDLRDRRRERGPVRQVLHEELQEGAAGDEGRSRVLGRRLLGRRVVRRQHRGGEQRSRGAGRTC